MKEQSLQREGFFGKRKVLCCQVRYPLLEKGDAPGGEGWISAFYARQARESLEGLCRKWYPLACRASRRLGEDFSPVEVGREYTVIYQGEDFFSAFLDTFVFRGERELDRSRVSHTFSLSQGRCVPLPALFRPGYPYRQTILHQVEQMVSRQSQRQPEEYYVDWPRLLSPRFSPENFYLASEGLVVYYPRRALGPSVLGLPSFLLPYPLFGSGLIPEL